MTTVFGDKYTNNPKYSQVFIPIFLLLTVWAYSEVYKRTSL